MGTISFIKIKNLNYYYPNQSETALSNINLEIYEGELVLLVGGSGSGKSTLVKTLAGLAPEFYGGKIEGSIKIQGTELQDLSRKERVQHIGMVFQDPENQLVMTNVEQEIAFGLENLGLPEPLMKRRVLEVSGALSLSEKLNRNIPELSGGFKQKVALASVLAMQPEILILDEPTSQLDPVAGEEILTIIRRLNEENGITIILIEQRLERCFHLADRFLFMDKGEIVLNTIDHRVISNWAVEKESPFLPPLAKIFTKAGCKEVPLTVKEGRALLRSKGVNYEYQPKNKIAEIENSSFDSQRNKLTPLLETENLWFVYENGEEALKNINFKINSGEFIIIMGENASGKTTFLKNLVGLSAPSRGVVKLGGQDMKDLSLEEVFQTVGYLSQNPNDYLFSEKVEDELLFTQKNYDKEDPEKVALLLERLGLSNKSKENPRDLSAGERQRVALASVLINEPQVILLDEPTRGLDYDLKEKLGELLLELQQEGKSIIVVTHDMEFAAEYGQEIILMSRGSMIARGNKKKMLTNSSFYSPQVSKLFNNINNEIVTIKEGISYLQGIEKIHGKNNGGENDNPKKYGC